MKKRESARADKERGGETLKRRGTARESWENIQLHPSSPPTLHKVSQCDRKTYVTPQRWKEEMGKEEQEGGGEKREQGKLVPSRRKK